MNFKLFFQWISSQIYRDPPWNFPFFCFDPLEIHVLPWNSNDFYSTPWNFLWCPQQGGYNLFLEKAILLLNNWNQYLNLKYFNYLHKTRGTSFFLLFFDSILFNSFFKFNFVSSSEIIFNADINLSTKKQ